MDEYGAPRSGLLGRDRARKNVCGRFWAVYRGWPTPAIIIFVASTVPAPVRYGAVPVQDAGNGPRRASLRTTNEATVRGQRTNRGRESDGRGTTYGSTDHVVNDGSHKQVPCRPAVAQRMTSAASGSPPSSLLGGESQDRNHSPGGEGSAINRHGIGARPHAATSCAFPPNEGMRFPPARL